MDGMSCFAAFLAFFLAFFSLGVSFVLLSRLRCFSPFPISDSMLAGKNRSYSFLMGKATLFLGVASRCKRVERPNMVATWVVGLPEAASEIEGAVYLLPRKRWHGLARGREGCLAREKCSRIEAGGGCGFVRAGYIRAFVEGSLRIRAVCTQPLAVRRRRRTGRIS